MRPLAKPLKLVCAIGLMAALLPLASRAYDVSRANGQVITWDPPAVSMQIMLGTSPLLSDGTNYNTTTLAAMQAWNSAMVTVQLSGASVTAGKAIDNNLVNEIAFGSQVYPGEDFDANTLAVTVLYYSSTARTDGTYRRTQADVIVNDHYTWDSYRGTLQASDDLRRVIAHELGHVLGLKHPDQATPPQSISALMNSHESNIDSLTYDDMAGVQFLYGARPTLSQQPFGQTAFNGATVYFSASASGTLPFTYQWLHNSSAVPGATASTLMLTNVQASDAGSYSVVVTNPYGTVTSSAATLTVNPTSLVPITGLPATVNVRYGEGLGLYASGGGGTPAPSFQWKKEGMPIAGATGGSYYVNFATQADSGTYTLTETNIGGSLTSSAVVVTVSAPIAPAITQQPIASLAVPVGMAAIIYVTVTGSNPSTMQWLFNGVPIPGANSSTYSISAVTAGQGGVYTFRMSNAAGTVESTPVALTVGPPALPVLGANTSNNTIGGGNSVFLLSRVTSAGSPPLTYQWFKDGVAIPGATSQNYMKYPGTESDAGNYSYQITNPAGIVMSEDIPLRWSANAAPWIDSCRLGNVVYFLLASPGRVLRYDLTQEAWLDPVTLTANLTPTAFLPTPEGVFIAYGATLAKRTLDLQTETPVATVSAPLQCLFSFGSLLYYQTNAGVESRNRTTLAAGPTFPPAFSVSFTRPYRPVFSTSLSRCFTTTGFSPSDIAQLQVKSDGSFPDFGDSPYHGDFPVGPHLYLSADEQFLYNNSGVVYRASDLTYAGFLGSYYQDLALLDDGAPIALRGKVLTLYDHATSVEAGRATLPNVAYSIFSVGSNTYAFGLPIGTSSNPAVTKVPRTNFGPAVSFSLPADRVKFSIENAFVDQSGVVNLISRSAHSVVRWSPQTHAFLAPLDLRGSPSYCSFSPTSNRLVVTYSDSSVTEFNFSVDSVERPLTAQSNVVLGVMALDHLTLLRVLDGQDTADRRIVLGEDGLLAFRSLDYYYGTPLAWRPDTRRLYSAGRFSPDDGMTFETVPTSGVLGDPGSAVTPLTAPLRDNAAGSLFLAGNGHVVNASLVQVADLGVAVTDGAWLPSGLYTIRPITGGTGLQQWSSTTVAHVADLTLPGVPLRIMALGNSQLVIVTLVDGYAAFHVVDSSLSLLGTWTNYGGAGAPVIGTQPASASFAAGSSVTLSVAATGGVLSYQWRRNGVPVAGATNSFVTINNAGASDSGAAYDVIVTNSSGSVTSSAANLTLSSGRLTQTIYFPTLPNRNFGDPAFLVTASASSGLLPTLTVVSGSATVSNNVVTVTGAGTVVVRARVGATAIYDAAPDVDRSFYVNPAPATVKLGNLIQLADGSPKTVTVTTLPANLATSVSYAGSTSAPSSIGAYYVTATVTDPNYLGSANDILAVINSGGTTGAGGGSPPTITTQPASLAATVGGSATFSVGTSGSSPFTYQWRRGGVAMPGEIGSSFTLSGLTLGDSGAAFDVVVSNAFGTVTSNRATLVVSPPVSNPPPAPPAAVGSIYFGTIPGGGKFAAYVQPGGEVSLIGYLPDGRGSFVVKFTLGADGSFNVSLPTAPAGSVVAQTAGNAAGLSKQAALILNGQIGGGSFTGSIGSTGDTLSGSVQSGSGPRASLAGYYEAPILNSGSSTIYLIVASSGSVLGGALTSGSIQAADGSIAASGAFNLSFTGGMSAQGSLNATNGAVTGSVSGGGQSGNFAGVSATTVRTDRLVNISTRGLVGDGENAMIAGFVVSGETPKNVLIRANGPTLVSFGLNGVMENPVLSLNQGADLIANNDDWGASTNAIAIGDTAVRVGAFAQNAGSKDSALVATLAPGIYSAQVTRVAGSTAGLALVEVYDAGLNPGAEHQKVINISTRAQVGTGESIMVAGFVITGNVPKKVLIRGIGPTLGSYGVNGTLVDPQLKLYAGDQMIVQNDDWSADSTAASAIIAAASKVGAFPLAAGSKDAAIVVSLAPGLYSAQVSGVNNTIGIALLEVYEVSQ